MEAGTETLVKALDGAPARDLSEIVGARPDLIRPDLSLFLRGPS